MTGSRLRLDPWAIQYDSALNVDPQHEPASETELAVEQAAGSWQPLSPQQHAGDWQEVLFLDGIRRMEARLHLEGDSGHLAHGALGTIAVGAVRTLPHALQGARAEFVEPPVVRRYSLLTGDVRHDGVGLLAAAGWSGELTYEPASFSGTDPAEVLQELQRLMQAEERRLASDLALIRPDALMLFDGSLPFQPAMSRMVGYVKTFSAQRVSGAELAVVLSLQQGQRSPLYLVRNHDSPHAYFEWFLRLRDPLAWHNSFAGMVRLQVHAGSQPDARFAWAQTVADWSALHLPAFATRAHQDPRAPQQLLPIRALEAELRRRMGNPLLLQRRVTREFHRRAGKPADKEQQ